LWTNNRRDLGLVDAETVHAEQQARVGNLAQVVIRVVPSPSTAIAPRAASTRIASSNLVKQ
jgi:hypothetical protein